MKGAELESTWEPIPGLRFNFAGGWEDTALAKGSQSVDLMDRTAGHPGWMVFKPFITQASNCILPTYVVAGILMELSSDGGQRDSRHGEQHRNGLHGDAYTPSHRSGYATVPYVQNLRSPIRSKSVTILL